MRIGRIAVAIAAMLLLAKVATAFEVDGYRAGMTVGEVRQVAEGRGLIWVSLQDSGQFAAFDSDELVSRFWFCSQKLYLYSAIIPGGVSAFTRIIERETTAHGRGQYAVENTDGSGGAVGGISISWKVIWGTLQVSLYQTPTNITSMQHWGAVAAICGRPRIRS